MDPVWSVVISAVGAVASAVAAVAAVHAIRVATGESAQKREAAAWVLNRFHVMNAGAEPTTNAANEGNLIALGDLNERERELAATAVTMGLLMPSSFGGAGLLLQLPGETKT